MDRRTPAEVTKRNPGRLSPLEKRISLSCEVEGLTSLRSVRCVTASRGSAWGLDCSIPSSGALATRATRTADGSEPGGLKPHPLSATHKLFEPRQDLHSVSLGLISKGKVTAPFFSTIFHVPDAGHGGVSDPKESTAAAMRRGYVRRDQALKSISAPASVHQLLDKGYGTRCV